MKWEAIASREMICSDGHVREEGQFGVDKVEEGYPSSEGYP